MTAPMATASPALATLARAAAERLDAVPGEPRTTRPHEDLLLLSHREPSDHLAQVYNPVACLVVQGAKETNTADRSYRVDAGQFLVVTHDLPVVARITVASPERPYLAVILSLDDEVLLDLHDQAAALRVPTEDDPYAVTVGDAGEELIDAFVRCLRATDDPADTEVLLPLASREIHYRILCSPQGRALRRLSLEQGPGGTVSRAIGLIRHDLSAKMSVDDIADHVGLSPSALHHHFKAVTGTTPVQFQKQLRLLEARRLIQSNAQSVTGAAYSVGYASPAQFSREYRRAFGHPPSHDRRAAATA